MKPESSINLPDDVIDALNQGRIVDAVKRLRTRTGLGLKEAKEAVDEYLASGETRLPDSTGDRPLKRKQKIPVLGLLVLAAITWAAVNAVEVAGSLIVIWHHGDYEETTFEVSKLYYSDHHESGLTWGVVGRIPEVEGDIRMYAPGLADAKSLGYGQLKKMYPPGTRMQVWYSPRVTKTLFQHRTLNIIPHTPDIVTAEKAVIYHWLLRCLLPLAALMFFARLREQSETRDG